MYTGKKFSPLIQAFAPETSPNKSERIETALTFPPEIIPNTNVSTNSAVLPINSSAG